MPIPKNPPPIRKEKIVYIPPRLRRLYRWQGEKFRIDRITNLERYHQRKRRFLASPAGRKFLSYRKAKFGTLHGLEIWLVDGNRLRGGQKSGDVDFTMGGHGYRYLYVPQYEIWVDELYQGTADLWPLIWHEYLERWLMRQGTSYNSAHTTASNLEIVLRGGTDFVLPIGTYRQRSPWTCGPAALKIVLDFLRWPISERYLAKLCRTGPEKGTNPEDIVRTAQELGFEAYEKQKMTAREVKKILRSGRPVIANFQLKPQTGEGHYAVIIGFGQDDFILSDPAFSTGYRRTKIKDFMRGWYELVDKTTRQGIVVSLP